MPTPLASAALFVNARSRRGTAVFSEAKRIFAEKGFLLSEAWLLQSAKHLLTSVENAVHAGASPIIIGGGDGTISAAAHFIAQSNSVLGVLPAGTGNSLARDLHIPNSIADACDVIVGGKASQIDMGLIGGVNFLNVSTLGISTTVAQSLSNKSKKLFGKAAYLLSLINALRTSQPFRVKLTVDGDSYEFDSLQVVIGNGRFHAGPFPITPDASITAGRLSVYALASRSKLDFLRMALILWNGRHVKLEDVRSFQVQSGSIETFPPQRITVDGENRMLTPTDFEVLPLALRVMTPLEFEG